MKVVLAVSGFAQAGKDTFADEVQRILEKMDRRVSRFKFAEHLRIALQKSFDHLGIKVSPWTESRAEKDKLRPLLVALGEYARGEDENVFAGLVAMEISQRFESGADIAIVTDMRYANEDYILRTMCGERGWRYNHIHIYRVGNKPANKAEADSVHMLMELASPDGFYTACDGDIKTLALGASDYVRTNILPITTSRSK